MSSNARAMPTSPGATGSFTELHVG